MNKEQRIELEKKITEATNRFIDAYSKDVWNAAIEEAAKKADRYVDHVGHRIADEIRSLKK